MKLSSKNIALFAMIILMMVMLFRTTDQTKSSSVSVSYSDFLNMVESGSITQVTIQGDSISGMSARGPFKTFVPKDPDLVNLLRSKGVKISAKPAEDSSLFQVFLSWGPHAVADRCLDIFHAANAGRGRKSAILKEKQGKTHE